MPSFGMLQLSEGKALKTGCGKQFCEGRRERIKSWINRINLASSFHLCLLRF